jgi:hypothetical protein
LDSKQIHEQLYDDSDSFTGTSHNKDIDTANHSGPDAKINRPDLSNSNSGCNSDDGQASANDGASGGNCGGGENNEDDNEDWNLWDKNDHDFCKTSFHASSGYKLPQNGQMPVSPNESSLVIFSAPVFKEITAETNRHVSVKTYKAMPLEEHPIWVRWEDITTEQLTVYHGVILNMARHVKCPIKDFFSEQWINSSVLEHIFKEGIFTIILGTS